MKHLNFVINSQGKIKKVLKSLYDKESLTDMLYEKISPVGCRSGILYGQAKVHKSVINNCPSFRPILDAINTPSYKLEKFLLAILSPLIINKYTVNDSFAFAKEITKTECNYAMASFRSSHPDVLLGKGVLTICSKFRREHPCRSAISIKLQSNKVAYFQYTFS